MLSGLFRPFVNQHWRVVFDFVPRGCAERLPFLHHKDPDGDGSYLIEFYVVAPGDLIFIWRIQEGR